MWLLLFLDVLILLLLLLRAAHYVILSWPSYLFFRKIAAAILAAVVGASAVAWNILHTTFQQEDEAIMTRLETISDEIVAATDVDLLKGLRSKEDYKTACCQFSTSGSIGRACGDSYCGGRRVIFHTEMITAFYNCLDQFFSIHCWMDSLHKVVVGFSGVFPKHCGKHIFFALVVNITQWGGGEDSDGEPVKGRSAPSRTGLH